MSVSFVILNYNSYDLTEKLVRKITCFKNIDEIVIVDNCSTDDSAIHLKQLISDKVILKISERNGGYSYGNNFGINLCKNADIVFVSNPDVNIEYADLEKIINAFANSEYSLLSGIQFEIDGTVGKPPILKRSKYIDDFVECFYLGRLARKKREYEKIDIGNECILQVDMFRGSFFGIRKKDFCKVGGFDENVFLYCEERILSKRLENFGFKMGILLNARYDHMHSASINRVYSNRFKKMKLLYNSRMYYNIQYNKIGRVKEWLLFIAMQISLIEFLVLDSIKGWGRSRNKL